MNAPAKPGTAPVAVSSDDVTILWAVEAELHGGLKPTPDEDETQGQRPYLWTEGWKSLDDYHSWEVQVDETQEFLVSMTYSCIGDSGGSELEIAAGESRADCTVRPTIPWVPEWGVEYSSFTKHGFDSRLRLSAGPNTIQLRARTKPGAEVLRLYTLELTPATAVDRLAAVADRARAMRASTDWFADARYGVTFHWTAETQPRHGARKPFPQAVGDFDVDSFAAMVAETGAGYVIFTSTHAPHFYPAPIQAIERLLPGNTCERDLIGDLAGVLQQRRIPLILYYPGGRSTDDTADIPWGQASGWTEDRELYHRNFCDIISEIGQRYGDSVAGFWFDFCPFNISHHFEPLYTAAKAGNPDRIVAWNSWLNLKPSDFQEIWAGEIGEFLHLPQPEHYGDLQPHTWFFLDDEWTHEEADTEIPAPLFPTSDLINHIKAAVKRNIPVSMNVGVYQDGSVSEATMAQLLEIKSQIRGE
jgi:hypothetical protein